MPGTYYTINSSTIAHVYKVFIQECCEGFIHTSY